MQDNFSSWYLGYTMDDQNGDKLSSMAAHDFLYSPITLLTPLTFSYVNARNGI